MDRSAQIITYAGWPSYKHLIPNHFPKMDYGDAARRLQDTTVSSTPCFSAAASAACPICDGKNVELQVGQ